METVSVFVLVLLGVLAGLLQPGGCGRVPAFYDDLLKRCDVQDQDSLDSCLYHILDSMRPFLPDGIPEWNIPVLEPLTIKAISLSQGSGNTRIRATFKDLQVCGLSNYTITYVKSDPAQYKFSIGLQFPTLHIEGKYNIFGNLILIPIKGQGPFWANFSSVTADSYNWLDVVHPSGPAGPGRLFLAHSQTDFDIAKVKLRLEQLFNNDEFLGETVNTFLNENAQDIIREVKPQFAQEIDRLVVRVFSEAIASLPVELWESLANRILETGSSKEPKQRRQQQQQRARELLASASKQSVAPSTAAPSTSTAAPSTSTTSTAATTCSAPATPMKGGIAFCGTDALTKTLRSFGHEEIVVKNEV